MKGKIILWYMSQILMIRKVLKVVYTHVFSSTMLRSFEVKQISPSAAEGNQCDILTDSKITDRERSSCHYFVVGNLMSV